MENPSNKIYKVISLRVPAEMLNRIDISAKNTRGFSRTTWIIQALDHQLKDPENISIPYQEHMSSRMNDVDKKMFITYDRHMKHMSKATLVKILLFCMILSGVAGCVGASVASGASIWSFASGFSDRSGKADKLSEEERTKLKQEIKEEIAKDLLMERVHPQIRLESSYSGAIS